MRKYILMLFAGMFVFGMGVVVVNHTTAQTNPILLMNGWVAGASTPASCNIGTGSHFLNTSTNVNYICGTGGVYIPIGQFLSTEGTEAATSANNAIVATGPVALSTGLKLSLIVTHTLQAGANTLVYNGSAAKDVKSHLNVANNIGTAYAAGSALTLEYDGTRWQDLSQ